MSGTRLIPRQPDNAAHSPPSRNLRDEGISRAKPLASWHTVNLRNAASSANHPNIRTPSRLFAAPTLECSDVRLGWQETRKRVLELRRPVTVSRDIRSLGRMDDDRTDLEVFQQCRDLVFGDWTSAAIFVPVRVWIGEKLLHHLLRCYLRAVLGKHRPQCREELNSHAGLIWSARKVYRRPTRLLGPTTTRMLRNLQRQFPVGTQPIVKTWRLRRRQFLDDTEVVGSPPCKLPPNRRELGIISVREVLSFFLGLFGPHR